MTPGDRKGAPSASGWRLIVLGFAAGAFSHLIFQGALGILLHAAGLVPELVWRLDPVPPLGVPTTFNNMFWDGLWGIVYALAEPRLTGRLGRLPGGLAFGFAPLLVFWLVVLPLKGRGLGGGFDPLEVLVQVSLDMTFGLGIAILFAAGVRLMGTTDRPRPD